MVAISTKFALIGPHSRPVYFVYTNGVMLRGKNGVGRAFKSQKAAIEAVQRELKRVPRKSVDKPKKHRIVIRQDGQDRSWHVWLNGQMLRSKVGNGRRFKTGKAAIRAAMAEIKR